MEFLLAQESIAINNENNKGYTPLLYACWKNTPEIAGLLLDKLKKDKYIIEKSNLNPLHICFEYFDETKRDIFEKVEKGGRGELAKIAGIVEKRKINDLKNIIDRIEKCVGKEGYRQLLEGTDKDGNIPLHYALYFIYGNARIEDIKELLTKLDLSDKNLINARNDRGFTPLHKAVLCNPNSPELVSFLVEKGAKINNYSYEGVVYPIHYAAQYSKCPEYAKILCGEKFKLLNIPDKCGSTPLHWAVAAGNFEMIRALIDLGADRDIPDEKYGFTPLHLAVQSRMPSNFIHLLHTPKNINSPANMEFIKSTPLLLAMHPPENMNADRNIVLQLLSDGADVKKPDCCGNTPLYYAVISCQDDLDIIEKLIKEAKNTVNHRNRGGETPLLRAVTQLGTGHAVVKALVSAGARL
jgi:ankyrin repeat protein